MNKDSQTRTILFCPNEQSMYQLAQTDKDVDCIIALTTSLDYEAVNGFFIKYLCDLSQTEKISLHDLSSLLKKQTSMKLIYSSLSVSEYLAMLYFVSIAKDMTINVHDFSIKRAFQHDDISGIIYNITCNELEFAAYQNAVFTELTHEQKEACHNLWRQLKDQNKLKCFIDPHHKQIQLLEYTAFDEQITQMANEHKSIGECYQYFLNNYGLSEQWLISRLKTLNLSLQPCL